MTGDEGRSCVILVPRTRRAFSAMCFGFLGVAITTAAALGQPPHQEATTLRQHADSLWSQFDSRDTPGCAVGVLQSGRAILRRDYGMADVPGGRQITPESVFPVQSMQKLFLAYAILRLEQHGRLRLDSPVSAFMPALALDTGVTLRRLIQHTSGLPDVGNIVQFLGWEDDVFRPRREWLAVIGKTRALDFAPGTRLSYSNAVQVILPVVIESVTRLPIDRAMQQLVFQPLSMSHTTYRVTPRGRAATLVTPHRVVGANIAVPARVNAPAVQTTRDDLLTFARFWLHARTTRDSALVNQMTQRTLLPTGHLTDYGLGLEHIRYRGVDAWYHGGDSPREGHSILILWPQFDAAVTVLCNSGGIQATGRAVQLSDAAFASRWNDAPARANGTATRRPAATFAGLYFTDDGGPALLRVRAQVESLTVVETDGALHAPLRFGDATFALPSHSYDWSVDGDTLWRIEGLSRVRFVRVGEPGAVDVTQLPGCYRDSVYGAVARITQDASGLRLRWGADTTTHQLTKQFSDGYSDGFVWLRLSRDSTGRVVGMSLHQQRVWRVTLSRSPRC